MFSTKSSAQLKIVGIEGHSAETLRDAVNRGAKFVIYSYNFSLLVISFKRPSNIHFVRPGENRIVKGLPFTLISLVFGWWGFPWGIIYTFQSLHQNLTGGTDVTRDLMASLAPTPEQQAAAAATGTIPRSPPPPAKPLNPRKILATVGVVAAMAAVVYVCVCFFDGRNLKVALVSGLKAPYTVELNGTSYKLSPNHTELATLAEGDFVLHGAPGAAGEEKFSAATDFFSRPFDRHVLVINPDRVAVVYRETTNYHPTGSTPDPNEKGAFDLHVNSLYYYLPEPDHFFEEFPKTISMPSGSTVVTKSRIAVSHDQPLEETAPMIREKLGYDAVRDYLSSLANIEPENEDVQRHIYGLLKPDDARKLFERHLADRPVLVEWHRAYEFLMGRSFPNVDLIAIYQKWMAAEPDNGTLIYLYARLLPDLAAAHTLYEKALQVKKPGAYAAYALATDNFAAGHYTECLGLLEQAERSGVHSESLQLRKRDALLALGRFDAVLTGVREHRAKDKTDMPLFADELMLSETTNHDRVAAQRAVATFVSGLRSAYGSGDYQPVDNYLASRLAYGLGEEREAATFSAKLKGPMNAFETAVGLRDHVAAAKAVAGTPDLPSRYYWILMLTAHAAGATVAADTYYNQAMTNLAKEDKDSRAVVEQVKANNAEGHAKILRATHYAEELRIMFTALGVRFPAQRQAYFARADELDHDPAFPHLLLQAVRKDAALSAKL